MRRILLVVSLMALMAAMMLATAVPAFADRGGEKGHTTVTEGSTTQSGGGPDEFSGRTTTTGNLGDCEPSTEPCQGTVTQSGKNKEFDQTFAGRNSSSIFIDDSAETDLPELIAVDSSTQGGDRYAGGGNCYTEFRATGEDFDSSTTGNGNRCFQPGAE